ncbi:MAG: ferritin-like domain-containing protein [Caldilineaceae bacterium]|nr:ferritin-like domain-containing protein [Caldilineaceae bacterium]
MSTKETLIQYLNEDLAAEYGTIIRYSYQSGKAFGLMGSELRALLAREIADELGHAAFLNDVIVDLGGEPVTTPATFDKPESLREMLVRDEQMELQDVKNYVAHAELADKLGFVELKLKLEEMAADEAGHARELRRILKGM